MQIRITLETAKGYKSEANLIKALEKRGLNTYKHVVCRKPDGDWTAVFMSQDAIRQGQCYMGFAAQFGFFTV